MTSSAVELWAMGESSPMRVAVEKGALCGRGEMSIGSLPGPGEDEGRGGVVMLSVST